MIDPDIEQEIRHRLAAVERDENVRIVLAIESGSRAWGFASPNSDYDVRFIYARPTDWYIAVDLEEKRDVLEYPIIDEIDLSGWDIRKALRLFWRSNPAFVEWLQSPIRYQVTGQFLAQALMLLPDIYSVEKGIYHYRSMAKTNYRGYLRGEQVPLKKYFYVLRPLLAARWLEINRTPAPLEFDRLLMLLPDDDGLKADVETLLARKKQAAEKEWSMPVASIQAFIETELERLAALPLTVIARMEGMAELNGLFQAVLAETPNPL